jgi:hypothetical protein
MCSPNKGMIFGYSTYISPPDAPNGDLEGGCVGAKVIILRSSLHKFVMLSREPTKQYPNIGGGDVLLLVKLKAPALQ